MNNSKEIRLGDSAATDCSAAAEAKAFVKSKKHLALEARVRETPLIERLVVSSEMIGKMCKEGRPPKMSIPVQPSDEDFFICTTLRDAAALIRSLGKPVAVIDGAGPNADVALYLEDHEGELLQEIDWPSDWPDQVTSQFLLEHGFEVRTA